MKAVHTHPLCSARCQRNLTINQLAEEAKVGASTIWRAEHSYPISAESRQRLCRFFNLTSLELGLVSDRREKSALKVEHSSGAFPAYKGSQSAVVAAAEIDETRITHIPSRPTSEGLSTDAGIQSGSSASALLAQTSSDLVALLEAGWSVNTVLAALRAILPGVSGMSAEARDSVYEMDDAAVNGDSLHISGEHVSQEERARLCNGLRQSVMESWQLYQSAPPAFVLVVAQTQLALVRRVHALLPAELRSSLYAALYNLIGAALLHLGQYAAAQKTHQKAHIAALEAADIWNMAQSLNWQAICANTMGHYEAAIECIESAMRLLSYGTGEQYGRLEAHLFADWAFNAVLLQEQSNVQEKLERSAALLEGLGPDGEFDLASWHQTAGRCMLLSQNYPAAIAHLERSCAELSPQWLVRQILTLVPLAEAYARQRERDASIATGEHIAAILQKMGSAMLNQRFIELQQQMLKSFPQDQHVREFIERARHQPLLHAARSDTAQRGKS